VTSGPVRAPLESTGYVELKRFLSERMSMSHVYQPLMIRTILSGGGAATRRQIAAAFLAADLSQLEYYEQITKGYPTQTLRRHEIITHDRGVYRLATDLQALSEWERASLIAACDAKLADYVAQRQDAIWRHRTQNFEPVPGTLRYEVIKRARGRCEACGVSNQERALQVDHIIPRTRGGTNDIFNLQALCSTCNAQKLDRDQTDFRAAHAAYEHRVSGCALCDPPDERVFAKNALAIAVNSAQSDGSVLLSPRRHATSYVGIHQPELNAIHSLQIEVVRLFATTAVRPIGFRMLMNCMFEDPGLSEHCCLILSPIH
jgi:ATP adenylyltransferase